MSVSAQTLTRVTTAVDWTGGGGGGGAVCVAVVPAALAKARLTSSAMDIGAPLLVGEDGGGGGKLRLVSPVGDVNKAVAWGVGREEVVSWVDAIEGPAPGLLPPPEEDCLWAVRRLLAMASLQGRE